MHEDYQMKSEIVEILWCALEWSILNTQKVWSSNKFKKWNPFVRDEFSFETLLLRKRLSVLYTNFIQFLSYSSQLFNTCYVGEMMIACQLSTFSEFICSAFQFHGHLAQKYEWMPKKTKWSQKGLKIADLALNGAFWTHKESGVQIGSK